jgi:quinoprotein glucose dehydrogenase
MREFLGLVTFLTVLVEFCSAHAQTNNPGEIEAAMKKFRVVPGFRIEAFAHEPLIQNPVSFTFDEQGRAYVVETHRRRTSVFDIRFFPQWVEEDFALRTVEDRSNFFKKVLVPGSTNVPPQFAKDRNGDGKYDWHDLEVESDRLRLVTDENGDGLAEKATTFAEGFNTLVSGVAAGVLARKGDVYFTCIPNLWLLRDTNNDGVADMRKSLAEGFGVHISSGGHDMHGLKMGPDGKLYFSIADRGLSVVSGNKKLVNPDSGAVLRCNPDGSELELFATGLRNPQELAFDQYGNLWTGDNNGDSGDKARWLYVVEGGEYGWTLGWQQMPNLGAWNDELLWEMPPTNNAAYLIPPIGHIGHGPAGLAFYPGSGMPAEYNNHFFMCDFPGGVNSFAVRGKGAGFELTDLRPFLTEMYPVDVDFGPRGGIYVLDWVQGWEKTGKGRLYHLFEEKTVSDAAVGQTRKLLQEGFDKRGIEELGILLANPDMRVRQEAQFSLAAKGMEATNLLAQVAMNSASELARLHAIWALGQIGRKAPAVYPLLIPLLDDATYPEIRAQAARVLGDGRYALAFPNLARASQDPIPRVRYFGLIGLGKLGSNEALEPILQALKDNNDADPFIRHAAVMALTWLNDINALETLSHDSSAAVRMAALLAMRKLERPEVAMFLYDSRPQLVQEAARAIYDLPIEKDMSQLAALISTNDVPRPALKRALHANYRLGRLENAMALSDFAAKTNAPADLRGLAVELLGSWGESPKRDLFTGLWHPLGSREYRSAALTFRSIAPELLRDKFLPVRLQTVKAVVKLGIDNVGAELVRIVSDKSENPELRTESLKALGTFKDPKLGEVLKGALTDADPALKKMATTLQARTQPGDAATPLLKLLEIGSVSEKQNAIEVLGTMQGRTIDPVISMWLDKVVAGKAPKEIEMEVLEAAVKRSDPLVKSQLDRYNERRSKDPMAKYSECLAGGDAEAGKKVFYERTDVACLRCHKIKGTGGEVGPDLTGIGSRATREYLLESIVLPNNRIAKGFENLVIRMKDGASHIGILKGDDAENIMVLSADEGPLKIAKASIETLDPGLSAMPNDLAGLLSKHDMRNLIEFLASQK